MTMTKQLHLIYFSNKRIEDSKILNWNTVHKYFIRDRLMFSLSASIFRLFWGRCSLLAPPRPSYGQRVGKEKELWKILEAGFAALIVLLCYPTFGLGSSFFFAEHLKERVLFCFFAGIGLSECFVYVCNKLISLLSKVAKQLINIVVS